ncbi:MAG TPA: 50S ribosomal protein L9 [Vicinamibacteria bacterium]|nr:50S ribosomal protein L9 [Vicinamibacteria bacterium]
MRLILREEVDNLGKRGQIVNVSRGFARNYLLPQRLAMEVSDNNLRLIEKETKVYEAKLAKEKEEAEVVAGALSAVKLTFRRKVHGEGQDLYGSVSLADLAEALEAKGFRLEKRKILLHEPLKTIGEFSISVKLHPEVTVSFPVVVEKEEE